MLYLLDYGGGNVASLANSVKSLGFEFKWIESVEDFDKADKILFPGVGAFGSALESLRKKGFSEPLKKYIKSGKPYMGICIGLQALFLTSDESSEPGLGMIPAHVGKFSSSDGKKVPCIGWNGTTFLKNGVEGTGIQEDDSYYFVHSYRVKYDESTMKDWALTLTQYGNETYVSSIQHGNIFATQFHPEKSGKAGLEVLKAWLSQPANSTIDMSKYVIRSQEERSTLLEKNGFTKRIVACLDVRANDAGDLVVTKGDQYDVRESATVTIPSTTSNSASTTSTNSISSSTNNDLTTPPSLDPSSTIATSSTTIASTREVRNLGKPVELAQRYFSEGADEIAFLNITSFRSCPLHDQPMLSVITKSAETVFVPLTIGGGIRDTVDPDGTKRSALEVAGTYFRCGADKVSIGSDAVLAVEELLANNGQKTGKTGIETISYAYGAQAVVVSVDPRRVYVNSLEEIDEVHRKNAVDLASTSLPSSSTSNSTPTTILKPDLGPNGERYCWYQCTISGGRESRDIDVVQLAQGVQALGAGEILLNSVDKDGSKSGFDLRLIHLVRSNIEIPVIASSGAGCKEDFEEVFNGTGVEAGLAAGIFHRKEVPLGDVKDYLKDVGIKVRV